MQWLAWVLSSWVQWPLSWVGFLWLLGAFLDSGGGGWVQGVGLLLGFSVGNPANVA